MKCRICASECPPGAKLCRDCAAARKRAFAATVTQPLFAAAGVPSVRRPRFAPRPARPRLSGRAKAAKVARSEAALAASAAEASAAPPKPPLGVQWLLLALAIASAVVYLLVRVLFMHHAPGADAPGDSASEAVAPAGTAASVALAPPPVASAAAPPRGAAAPEEGKALPEATALKNTAPKAGHRKLLKAEIPAPPPAAPQPPPPEPAPAPRSAPPPPVEAPRDPWQAMNEGLSRCAREDWINRGACEQRLRLQYCPGHWGVVWQCPIGPQTDHGQ